MRHHAAPWSSQVRAGRGRRAAHGRAGSACSVPGLGPDADEAMDELAAASAAGNAEGRRLRRWRRAAKKAATVVHRDHGRRRRRQGLGRPGLDRRRPRHRRARLALERRVEDLVLRQRRVRLTRGETADGDAWLVRWDPAVVEPSLKEGERLGRATDQARARRDPRRRGRSRSSRRGPVLRVGLDKTGLPLQQAATLRDPARAAPRRRRRGLRQAGQGDRPQGVRAGHRLPQQDGPAGVLAGADRHPRCAAPSPTSCRWRPPRTSPPRSWARSVRRPPSWSRTARAGSRPATTSASPACRRGTTSSCPAPAGRPSSAVDDEGSGARCSPPSRWPASSLRTTLDVDAQGAAEQALADVGPAERPRRDPALHR